VVKGSMTRKQPAFDESEYGQGTFAKFLESARDKGLVSLSRDDRAGGYRVDVPDGEGDEGPPPSDEDASSEPDLPPLTGKAAEMRAALDRMGINPLTPLVRHTVIYEFADHVQKRNTLMYVTGDIARRCRKTEPVIPPRHVKAVINALSRAGELLHSDGNPVRSPGAAFSIKKDAEELLESLKSTYLRALRATGQPIDDASAVSQLLWGDEDHMVQAEEVIAWVLRESESPAGQAATPPAEPEEPVQPAREA
jgi:hypothetical protein